MTAVCSNNSPLPNDWSIRRKPPRLQYRVNEFLKNVKSQDIDPMSSLANNLFTLSLCNTPENKKRERKRPSRETGAKNTHPSTWHPPPWGAAHLQESGDGNCHWLMHPTRQAAAWGSQPGFNRHQPTSLGLFFSLFSLAAGMLHEE